MATLKVPYLKFRNGRPRWEPGPRLRDAGFHGRDLKDDAGAWLPLERAIEAAAGLNREVDEWRATGARARRLPRATKDRRTCRALWELYCASPKFAKLARVTRTDYASKASVWLAEFGDIGLAVVRHADLYTWWEELYQERGHAMANGVLAVVRAVLSYGVKKGWRQDNPAKQLGLESLAPRCVVWTPDEVAAFVRVAESLGEIATADAVVIALHTGQRQGDVLALEHIATEHGRCVFRQSKRGARVSVPHTPQLEQRLAAIRGRRAAQTVADFGLARRVILDTDGRELTKRRLNIGFKRVRARVAAELPAIADKLFLDLRDTAVTRLALAGATVAEIRSITGHTLASVHKVLEHYLALDHRMADAAVAKLRDWMAAEGIAI